MVLLLAMPLALAAMAQTHATLVGYLDLSVGSMISFGVVVGSFLIGADASTFGILKGIAVVLACGLGLGLVNAVLIRGLKIPSLIATLATLSILDGISLTMRPTAQGVISDDLVSFLRTSIGPIPIAFILIVIGAGVLDLWLHASGSGLEVRAVGFDDRAAKRGGIKTNWIRVRALLLSGVIGAVAALFVMVRSPIGNAQIGSSFTLNSITAAVLGGAALAGGRATFIGSTVAAVLLALIITALPFLGLSPTDGSMIIGLLVLVGIVLFQFADLNAALQTQRRQGAASHARQQRRRARRRPQRLPGRQRLLGGAHRAQVDQERIRAQHRSPDRRGRRLRRADRRGSDRRRRQRPGGRRRDGHRRVRHDRHARLRRQPPPQLGGRAAQHRHRRATGGPIGLPLARAAQVGAGVPARGRLRGQPVVGAGRDRRRNHHPVGLVAHPGLTRPHRCRRPGVGGLRDAGRVRVRLPVVGEVGRSPAELVRTDGHRAFRELRTSW